MQLVGLELENVRSFSKYQSDFSKNINLIYGGNGIGKTTILEAVYILSISKSFRPGLVQNIVRKGEKNMSISGEIRTDDDDSGKIGYYWYNNEKRIKINGRAIDSLSDLVGVFPVVIMSPEDEDIISGSAQIRRNYINRILSITDKQYLQRLREYEKIRRHRNALLQQGQWDQVKIWSEPLAEKVWKSGIRDMKN